MTRKLVSAIGFSCLLLAATLPVQVAGSGVALARDLSPQAGNALTATPHTFRGDVRTLPHVAPRYAQLQRREFRPPSSNILRTATDGAAQQSTPLSPAPAPSASFAGLDFHNWGGGWPPDTNGDVGPDYYIQTVNTAIGIFRKSDGTRIAAFGFDTLFGTVNDGTPCTGSTPNNEGDPVVLYDSFKDRWIITDFASTGNGTGTWYECMAVSMTGDPVNGGWHFYSWQTNTANVSDYPKLGIWPDGLYMSANLFANSNGHFSNVEVFAFDKNAMEAGTTAHAWSVNLPSKIGGADIFSLLPSNARLQTGAPPAGEPDLFMSVWGSPARFWKFHFDPTTPSNSWFGTSSSNSAPFASTAVASFAFPPDDVAELSPGNALDTLNGRVMMQNQYQNTGGSESLWDDQAVANSTNNAMASVRWYQFNVTGDMTGTTASVVQQQTFQPDSSLNRWMSSGEVDKLGDYAIGYSTANASTAPAIKYAGRLTSDPVNTLGQGEQLLVQGNGYECCKFSDGTVNNRWGDYSAMTLDPDGCNFWYTNEYMPNHATVLNGNGTNDDNWQTRIGKFKLNPNCSSSLLSTTLAAGAASGSYGGTVNLTATLTSPSNGGAPVIGRTVNFTLNGSNAGSAVTDESGVATLSNVSLAGINIGTYATGVGASFTTDNVYTGSTGSNTLTVSKLSQTISFPTIPTHIYGDPDFDPGATASSGLAVSYAASGNCTIVSGLVHLTSPGSCTVTASQSGNNIYNPATSISHSFIITASSSLGGKVDYPTGTQPESVTSGDFTNDGSLDLASANSGTNNVSVLLANGNGSFQPKTDYATGTSPYSVTTGDFNGDGNLDLAVANRGSDTVSVLLGTGNGGFQTEVHYATGTSPDSVIAGDFNGDGILDLAVANSGSHSVSILLGNADGTFQPSVGYTTGQGPASVTIGDFNGDGVLDLAVANSASNTVSILLGNGNGTFQTQLPYITGTSPTSVVAGDFNGDGILDLAVANSGSDSVSVLRGNSNGTFQGKVDYATGTGPSSVTAGDFNSDGILDLAVANYSANSISLLRGNGNGTFASKKDYPTGAGPHGIIAANLHGRGTFDLVSAGQSANAVSVLLNSSASPLPYSIQSEMAYTLTASDGTTWVPMDTSGLQQRIVPACTCQALIMANSSLWTNTANLNQDIGIRISGGKFGAYPGTLLAWQESGSGMNVFSPNAATVTTKVAVQSDVAYTITLVWKSNVATTGQIWASAGKAGGARSPTSMQVEMPGWA